MRKEKAFTLIELLIVVAIIAILAAIAVPNFLEAQTRSKVARVKSDIRTLATGIGAYTVDWNVPVPEAGAGPGVGVFAPLTINGIPNQTGILSPAVSTPIAYISSSDVFDPFVYSDSGERPDLHRYSYHTYTWKWWPDYNNSYVLAAGDRLSGTEFESYYGQWRLFSIGPDKQYDNIPGSPQFQSPAPVGMPYDPTNGTISDGNIIRSQRYSEQLTWKEI